MATRYWLLKAEPDSRVVKGKDVKFSVDDFEAVQTSPWEGVRNYQARNFMKEMQIGEQAFFYHSNCKNPGIAATAEVAKMAYPDYTAWDSSHPYFDAKSDKDSPRWYMVDLLFKSRTRHFVPLSLIKRIASGQGDQPPEEVKYIGEDGVRALKAMDLVTRGRLSVQRVEEDAWEAITKLAENGGWDASTLAKSSKSSKGRKKKTDKTTSNDASHEELQDEAGTSTTPKPQERDDEVDEPVPKKPRTRSKRKQEDEGDEDKPATRTRGKRTKTS
ncbi:DUF55-domain-containing protein [Pluteus cervinus]|uniref:DUF55-domain-containing protein n=1 Tax=Pluteus cervinus TaxID=181527 RepID=A0ACD3ABC2_9AGAR|nr:DUF55-domain-containing protein [Pluteus cervinus]